ncbi:cystathionine beta-lyase [Nitratireductor pacificus]|uniref:Cystathionine beta-lyase n=1 Tax=Nitratireductor pacificus pht-3B TaxID=391937 RepID=K2LKQ9_9HYPH|nr:cystathionine beta-lyase [Nitratireductor pacificus]EKF18339.1 cystathionine beta-lyase [Nitratireductor pacificus pht-3B]
MKKDTKIARLGRPHAKDRPVAVNPEIVRASTILFPDMDSYDAAGKEKYTTLRYGRHGTQTAFALADAVAELEGGYRAIVMPSGLAAVSAALLTYARPGSHLLMTDNVYGPTRNLCESYLRTMGVDVEYFAPRVGAAIADLIRPETVAIYCESPGSGTFELQDIPAIASVAAPRGIPVMNDNTWATPLLFPSFEKGVDVSVHAATKYIVGHSDAMLGLIVCSEATWGPVRNMVGLLGYSTAPDDCYLALRGLRTMGLRLERHQQNALKIARWLEGRPEVAAVHYPALESHPDNALWKRDFTGASGLFAFRLKSKDNEAARRFADGLDYFGIGSSWGGFESLITIPHPTRNHEVSADDGVLVRLHVGLEDPDDLIADLAAGLTAQFS